MFDFPLVRKKANNETAMGLHSLDRIIDDFFGSPFSLSAFVSSRVPRVDVLEKGSNVIVKAELPGVAPDDIHISVDGTVLTIAGEKKQEQETKDDEYYRLERSYGSFQRVVALPSRVNEEKAKARYKNGVLTIELPKTEMSKKKIEIERM